jgi:hypothetical protein
VSVFRSAEVASWRGNRDPSAAVAATTRSSSIVHAEVGSGNPARVQGGTSKVSSDLQLQAFSHIGGFSRTR